MYPGDSRGTTRELLCKKHRVFYRVKEQQKTIEILAVWHGARQEPELPD